MLLEVFQERLEREFSWAPAATRPRGRLGPREEGHLDVEGRRAVVEIDLEGHRLAGLGRPQPLHGSARCECGRDADWVDGGREPSAVVFGAFTSLLPPFFSVPA